MEFVYVAFAIGTTFAVSDVENQDFAIRVRVKAHGMLTFLHNKATLGIAIGMITGTEALLARDLFVCKGFWGLRTSLDRRSCCCVEVRVS